MSPREGRPALRDPVLLLLLGASLALNLYGISWGLPSVQGWAMDELLPAQVLEGMSRHFSGGWYDKYPPFHYYLLAAAYAPVLRANHLAAGAARSGGCPLRAVPPRPRPERLDGHGNAGLRLPVRPRADGPARLAPGHGPRRLHGAVRLLRQARQPRRALRLLVDAVAPVLRALPEAAPRSRPRALRPDRGPRERHQGPGRRPLRSHRPPRARRPLAPRRPARPRGSGRARRGRGGHGALPGPPQPGLELGRLPGPPPAHHRIREPGLPGVERRRPRAARPPVPEP